MVAITHQAYFGRLAYDFTVWWKWIIVEIGGELLQLPVVVVLWEPIQQTTSRENTNAKAQATYEGRTPGGIS